MKIIKIGAVWCPGCLVMSPRWADIENEFPELETEYYDYDNDQDEIDTYAVEEDRLPVFIFLDDTGEEINRISGEYSKEELEEILEEQGYI
jgi:thiol-disulfide isomerase/thioredoxin